MASPHSKLYPQGHKKAARWWLTSAIVLVTLFASNNVSCTDAKSAPLILYASRRQVLVLSPHSQPDVVLFSERNADSNIVAFDLDVIEDTIYVATIERSRNRSISRVVVAKPNGSSRVLFGDHTFDQVVDIALDWVTKNLYLIEAHGKKIRVCRTDRPDCAELFTKRNGAHSIVVDPAHGQLFWSESYGRIYQGSMDGKVSQIFAMEEANRPLNLVMDPIGGRFYWHGLPNQTVGFHQLDRNKQDHIKLLGTGTSSSFAAFDGKLYWSNVVANRSTVQVCEAEGCAQGTVIAVSDRVVHSRLKAISRLIQPGFADPCRQRPCSHICVLSGRNATAFSCLCPRHFLLVSKAACKMEVPFFFVAAGEELFRLPAQAVLTNDPSVPDVVTRVPRFATMAIDDAAGVLYAVDTQNRPPRLISLDFSSGLIEELRQGGFEETSSLQFDPLHRLLYWLDILQKTVILYNVDRRELTRMRLYPNQTMIHAVDLAVDVRRGRLYVLFTKDNDGTGWFIERHNLDGTMYHELPKMLFRPSRIAVDHSTGNLVGYDPISKRIVSFNVETGTSWAIAQDVASVKELISWQNYVFWTTPTQSGFFAVTAKQGNTWHVVRDYWTSPTSTLAISGLQVKPIPKTVCTQANGGCSHTCIDSLEHARMCVCPDGMKLALDEMSCTMNDSPISCAPHELPCANGYQCVHSNVTCDGVKHCDDRSDETALLCHTCPSDMHRCPSSFACISPEKICDLRADCDDMSDEAACTPKDYGAVACWRIQWYFAARTVIVMSVCILAAFIATFACVVYWHNKKVRSMDTTRVTISQIPVTLTSF